MNKPIVLVGPMGVGKTTIGKKLAKRLDLTFIDTDKLISKKHGSISKFFEVHGEAEFRKVESEIFRNSLSQHAVIATGGGVVLLEENRLALRTCFVIYLSTDGKHIASRLLAGKRPLLKNGVSDWKRIYEERKPLYMAVANREIQANGKQLSKILDEIELAVKDVSA